MNLTGIFCPRFIFKLSALLNVMPVFSGTAAEFIPGMHDITEFLPVKKILFWLWLNNNL